MRAAPATSAGRVPRVGSRLLGGDRRSSYRVAAEAVAAEAPP
jgi:hypothetical protein